MNKDFNSLFESLPGTGWLSREEAELLWRMLNSATGPILEVGCYHGRTTCLLAATGRPVYVVDPFEGFSSDDPYGRKAMRAFQENMKSRNIQGGLVVNWEKIPVDVQQAGVWIWPMPIEIWNPLPIGFAYLDGHGPDDSLNYGITKEQICVALLGDPGIIAVHDVNDSGGGKDIKRAAVECLGDWTERVGRLAVWKIDTTEQQKRYPLRHKNIRNPYRGRS